MGDTIYGYVQMANSPPVSKFTDATVGQTAVMDNIVAAGDVVSVILNDNPLIIEQNSATVEVGQSFTTFQSTSSPITDRILFESAEGRMAFIENVLSQIGLMKPALGIPIQPEMVWRDEKFEAGTQPDRDSINTIETAPDAITEQILLKPLIRITTSPTIKVNEAVILMDFVGLSNTIKVHVSNQLDLTSFFHKFIIPVAGALALAGIVVRT